MNIVIIISEKKRVEPRMDELTLEEMDRDNQFHWIRLLFVVN